MGSDFRQKKNLLTDVSWHFSQQSTPSIHPKFVIITLTLGLGTEEFDFETLSNFEICPN